MADALLTAYARAVVAVDDMQRYHHGVGGPAPWPQTKVDAVVNGLKVTAEAVDLPDPKGQPDKSTRWWARRMLEASEEPRVPPGVPIAQALLLNIAEALAHHARCAPDCASWTLYPCDCGAELEVQRLQIWKLQEADNAARGEATTDPAEG